MKNRIRLWDELSEIEQLATYYSDLYKDVFGCRPRGAGHPQTVEEYKSEMDRLGEILVRQLNEQKADERVAYGEWKVNIRKIMGLCSCSKAEAIKIDIDANDPIWSIKDFGVQDQIVEGYIYDTGIGWDKQTELMELLNAR